MDLIGFVIERFYTNYYLLTQCMALEKSAPPPLPPLQTLHSWGGTQPLSVTSVVLLSPL